MLTSDFDFHLPPERIAQQPVEPRDHARLLHVMPPAFAGAGPALADAHVYDLPDILRAGDLLVINDTKVIPARLYGLRGNMKTEILLHKKRTDNTWLAFARPGKRLRVGDEIIFAPGFAAEILQKHDGGEITVKFSVPDEKLPEFLQKYGEPPLPPYIRREAGEARQDQARYQTIYAAREGAIAAPTAGLHFTPELLAKLEAKNISRVNVTLHVGAGTFQPVKAERVSDHIMHSEWGEISAGAADAINAARRESRRIVAVGTTSLRLLESAADKKGIVRPFSGETDIFIYPGYHFKTADTLMTNFHLPKSTLFMLVSAFAGVDRIRAAYAHAMAQNYRFYSYGDAVLLER
jgi:S-adenosylmethionine:tRNA ribosyltransferase-isomerase